jgi:predicted RNA-binding protein with PIN domain
MPERLLIVDGYNVLRAGDYYRELRDQMPDFGSEAYNAAREALINDVTLFAGHEYQALIVFDGAGNRYSVGQSTTVGRVEVVFSPAGVSADSVIEERAKQAAAKGSEVLVVTSDATTQWTVFGKSISRMSAAGFYDELRMLQAESSQSALEVSPKYTLGDRLDPEVLQELRRRFG